MDARSFLDKYGREKAKAVAESAGTNLAYFEQFACGSRRPSYELAQRLVTGSEGELDLESLMQAKALRAARSAPTPQPSKAAAA